MNVDQIHQAIHDNLLVIANSVVGLPVSQLTFQLVRQKVDEYLSDCLAYRVLADFKVYESGDSFFDDARIHVHYQTYADRSANTIEITIPNNQTSIAMATAPSHSSGSYSYSANMPTYSQHSLVGQTISAATMGGTINVPYSTSPKLPEIIFSTVDDNGTEITMTLKPEPGISTGELTKIMMLLFVLSLDDRSVSPYAYVKTNDLERHFKFEAA